MTGLSRLPYVTRKRRRQFHFFLLFTPSSTVEYLLIRSHHLMNMKPRTSLIGILLTVTHCVSFAQIGSNSRIAKTLIWTPPEIGWWDNMPRPTVPKEMIGALRVGSFSIVLEDTKLEGAQKTFGGKIGSHGDAGDAEAWLCLHGRDANGPWIIWLTSGEIDGPAIGGFQWRHLSPNQAPDRRCNLLPLDNGGIELPIALHLGMAEAEVQKVLGQPTVSRGKTQFYLHEHQAVIDKENYTVSNDVAIIFREGKVWVIEAAKTTGN